MTHWHNRRSLKPIVTESHTTSNASIPAKNGVVSLIMDHQLLIAATNALSCIMIYKYLDLLPSYFPPFQHHSLPSCVLSATLADVLFVATIFSRMSPFLYPSLLHAPVIRTWSERLLILKFASSLTSFVTISMAFGCVKEDFHRHHESLTSLRSRYAVSIYIWKF